MESYKPGNIHLAPVTCCGYDECPFYVLDISERYGTDGDCVHPLGSGSVHGSYKGFPDDCPLRASAALVYLALTGE